jgi:benzylsuccinate CoA-transferase BbsF subunit
MGFPDQRPRGVGVAYPDFTSPHLLVTTILAALHHRRRTGEGQELDLAQLSGLVSLLGIEWMQYRASGQQPPPSATRTPNYCPHGIYAAAGDDQWCSLAVETDEEWAGLAELLGRGDLAALGMAARRADEHAVDEAVRAWTARVDKWEIATRLQEVGIAAAPVEDLSDTYERDPQLRHHYQIVHQPSAPEVDIPVDGEAIRFAGVRHDLVRAPAIGEHNEYVIRDLLGYTDEEYIQLIVDNVLE